MTARAVGTWDRMLPAQSRKAPLDSSSSAASTPAGGPPSRRATDAVTSTARTPQARMLQTPVRRSPVQAMGAATSSGTPTGYTPGWSCPPICTVLP